MRRFSAQAENIKFLRHNDPFGPQRTALAYVRRDPIQLEALMEKVGADEEDLGEGGFGHSRRIPSGPKANVGVVFVNGYSNDMFSKVCLNVENFIGEGGYHFVKFDYSGVGKSLEGLGSTRRVSKDVGSFGSMASGVPEQYKKFLPKLDKKKKINPFNADSDEGEIEEEDDDFLELDPVPDPLTWSFAAWKQDVLGILDKQTPADQKQILVGYDIGFWLAMLAAKERPDKVAGILAVGANFDCFEKMFEFCDVDVQKKIISGELGKVYDYYDKPVPLNKAMVDEGKRMHLFTDDPFKMKINFPLRFIHPFDDRIVPQESLMNLCKRKLDTKDIEFLTISDADHSMMDSDSVKEVCRVLGKMLNDKNMKSSAIRRRSVLGHITSENIQDYIRDISIF